VQRFARRAGHVLQQQHGIGQSGITSRCRLGTLSFEFGSFTSLHDTIPLKQTFLRTECDKK
jgi:hypothetical protein